MEIKRLSFSLVLPALCLLILVSASSVHGQKERKDSILDNKGKCIKEGSFLNDCNRCICRTGSIPRCTYQKCIPKWDASSSSSKAPQSRNLNRQEGEKLESILNFRGKCMKDGTFLDDCNRCVCQEGGVPRCTYMNCRHKRETPGDKISPSGKCKPGDKWKLDECNNCHCTHTGYASCTLNECSPKKKGKRSTQQSKMDQHGKCKPGDKWQLDECNSCTCTHTGYASCTLNDCKDKKRGKRTASIGKPLGNSGNECRAGHSWKENCNSCFCSERGIAMCTDMACPTPPPLPKN